jgi:hypothetical protein
MTDKAVTLKSGQDESVLTAREKEFKTGSSGFFVFGKAMVDGKRCQFSGYAVIIGSKPEKKK